MSAPYANTPMAILIDDAMSNDARTREIIAKELGIQPNLLSMFRHGSTALPIDRVEAVASVLGIPTSTLVVAGIASYPDVQAWRGAGLVMRLRLRDMTGARLPSPRVRRSVGVEPHGEHQPSA